MIDSIAWPPPYTIRRHPRAKSVKLYASRADGLVISTPKRFSLKHIPSILEEHREWIIERLHELQVNQITELPTVIELPALTITIANPYQSHAKIVLRLRKIARDFLSAELVKISQECNLPFRKFSLRNQKTMWGSCSAKGDISLNYKLIFLPYTLMRHIIVHELCHTKHHNHSARFWKLVASFDAQWREHKRQLRMAENLIPSWL